LTNLPLNYKLSAMNQKLLALVVAGLALCLSTASGQQTAGQAQTPPPVQLSPWVLHAKLKQELIPEYPQAALDHQVQGDAFVDVVVGENGTVERAQWVGCVNCSSILGHAALEAVKKWEYQPTLVDGKAVTVSSWIAFHFRLEGKPSVEILSRAESSTPAAEPPRAPRPAHLRVSAGVAEANMIHKVVPVYPSEARAAHVQGDVVIQCAIDGEGQIAHARVISGDPLLAPSALEAVKQWKYKPYTLNGEPVEVETVITVRFHM
jgi:TonB family protein